ncbi:hypothetical protein BJV77DRAFT_1062025 [Russula vinacea]|nr:hypothetical protein BJV77DRAFT_1062025 [Russula vinacea]
MSSTVPINQSDITAPTPQNTPLTHAPISAGLSRPTVPDISEDAEPIEETANVHDAVFGLVQGRLAGLLGKSSGYIESLPDGAKKTIEALKGVQVKQNELQNQYKRECLELEKKYLELTKPLYARRRALIHATDEPSTEELEAGAAQSAKDDADENPLAVPSSTIPAAVPEFWLTALRNHVGLSELITDRDASALKHLTDLRIEYLPSSEPKPGFKLIFEFSQTNISKMTCSRNTNRTRLVRKAHPTESFFNFFSPPAGEIGEEELDELEEKLEIDYQIGEDIKEKVIPRAIDYFTGKALEYDMLSEDEDDYDDEDDDDDDDDDVDELDVDDSDEEVPPTRRGARAGGRGGRGGPPAANVNPEECKQQ